MPASPKPNQDGAGFPHSEPRVGSTQRRLIPKRNCLHLHGNPAQQVRMPTEQQLVQSGTSQHGAYRKPRSKASFGGVIRVKRSDMSWVRANRYVSVPIVIGDDVFATETSPLGWMGMTRVESDGAVTVIRAPANKYVFAVTYDGTYVYWTEQFGSTPGTGQPHFELWRSVYTRDISAFNTNAERIVALEGSYAFYPGIFFNDVYATAGETSTLVIRVSDKQSRLMNVAPGVTQSWPFYADQNDTWVRFEGRTALETHYAKITIDW
jgi:hypothetical protein